MKAHDVIPPCSGSTAISVFDNDVLKLNISKVRIFGADVLCISERHLTLVNLQTLSPTLSLRFWDDVCDAEVSDHHIMVIATSTGLFKMQLDQFFKNQKFQSDRPVSQMIEQSDVQTFSFANTSQITAVQNAFFAASADQIAVITADNRILIEQISSRKILTVGRLAAVLLSDKILLFDQSLKCLNEIQADQSQVFDNVFSQNDEILTLTKGYLSHYIVSESGEAYKANHSIDPIPQCLALAVDGLSGSFMAGIITNVGLENRLVFNNYFKYEQKCELTIMITSADVQRISDKEFAAVVTDGVNLIVFAPQKSQDVNFYFVNLRGAQKNEIYTEREDEFDKEPGFAGERLVDVARRNARAYLGFPALERLEQPVDAEAEEVTEVDADVQEEELTLIE